MSNSPLVTYTKLSPNFNPRIREIDTITICCIPGQLTARSLCNRNRMDLDESNNNASCNYVIGCDGSIGLIVEERNRSWCTSNRDNDHRAITIEVASDTKHPYAVTDAAYKALINLLVDICIRNKGIGSLRWKGDKALIGQPDKQNMTVHRWFDPKARQGEYLHSRHAQIAAEVNARLSFYQEFEDSKTYIPSFESFSKINEGDLVSLGHNAKYYNGTDMPPWIRKKRWYVKKVTGDRVVINKSEDGENAINSPVNAKYLTIVKTKSDVPYMVRVDIDGLTIRQGPGSNHAKTGKHVDKGVFTIVDVEAGWGKLKSGDGWISLDNVSRV